MDIDAPTSSYSFSTSFPLPFRVLALSFSTLLAFATNLHLLALLGIDTSLVLDITLDSFRAPSSAASSSTPAVLPRTANPAPFVHPSRLYPPLYHLALVGLAWTALGWLVFAKVTGGDPEEMVRWRVIPAAVVMGVGVALFVPWNVLYRRERRMFTGAMKRIMFSPLHSAVPFSDVILADILTSSAKVLGDVWVSGCIILTVTDKFGLGAGGEDAGSCARVWMVPLMTALPYLFRFRQCLSEVVTGAPTPRKSLLNALKYATAFPVILFSAMQTVVGDPFDDVAVEGETNAWIGRQTLFSLWILAVLANSLYSFWWDVTNDWGLAILTPSGWTSAPSGYKPISTSSAPIRPPPNRTLSSTHSSRPSYPPPSSSSTDAPQHSPHAPLDGLHASYDYDSSVRSPSPSKTFHTSSPSLPPRSSPSPHPLLRTQLLFPDTTLYYLAILIDLILRLTWSLKLSSYLHSVHEIEGGIFLMEALEVARRWGWVYFRIEWEAVRRGNAGTVGGRKEGGETVEMGEKDGIRERERREEERAAGPAVGRERETG